VRAEFGEARRPPMSIEPGRRRANAHPLNAEPAPDKGCMVRQRSNPHGDIEAERRTSAG
jgi:hypothetical protein